MKLINQKSRIRETLNLLNNAESSTDTENIRFIFFLGCQTIFFFFWGGGQKKYCYGFFYLTHLTDIQLNINLFLKGLEFMFFVI